MPGASAGPGEDRTSGVARLLQVMGRSARRAQGRDGIVVEAFRGYGSKDRMVDVDSRLLTAVLED